MGIKCRRCCLRLNIFSYLCALKVCKKMNVAIDQGNACLKAGVFDGEELIEETSSCDGQWTYLLEKYPVGNSIVSSVGDGLQDIVRLLQSRRGRLIELNEHTRLPIANRYKTPATLGKDRLATAVAAHGLMPGRNCLVIDAGTCITYDFVNDGGEFLGGNISPGMAMRFRALNAYTKRLPLLSYSGRPPFLGDSTESAICAGVVHGISLEMDGYIGHLKERYADLSVFLTGGDTIFFENTLKSSIFAHPFLALAGLNRILNYNTIDSD